MLVILCRFDVEYKDDGDQFYVHFLKVVLKVEMVIKKNEGLTLVEMLLALSIVTVICAVLLPQISTVSRGWAAKEINGEIMQNARVLTDHMNFNLSKLSEVTAVSNSDNTSGYIEFKDNDSNSYSYRLENQYVQFGPVGNLEDLAGPLSELRFTCYDACDLETPITDVSSIRSIRTDVTFLNSNSLSEDKSFSVWAYIYTNASLGDGNLLVNGDFED